ncbi:MAG: glycosyltransferase family 4 protein [Clostridiales bacterium]|nr:glycosyltransferase family 4 protein [Clostridiales bacterium]
MNILLIHQYFLEKEDAGGSRWNEMVKYWADQGNNIKVIAGMVHYATGKKYEKYHGKWTCTEKNFYRNVDVVRTHVSASYNRNFLGRLWAYFSFVISGIWGGLFKAKGSYDIIIVSSPPLFVGIIAYILSVIKGVPFVFEIRDLWPESAIDTGVVTNKLIIRFAYALEAFLYRKARLINVLTPAFRDKLINDKNVPKERIILIPNAADFALSDDLLNRFDAEKFRKEQALEGKFVVTYVGAHGVANHLIQLIQTAELLKETNVLFLLIGDGMEKKMLTEEVVKRKLNNVRFVDPVPKHEVFKYIIASDLGTAVLKRVDTFKTIYSNKTFDYMACRKPVLMIIDGVSRELVETAKCGLYAEPENPEDIAIKIKMYLNNSKQLVTHGQNGYAFAKQNFDRKVLAEKYLDALYTIV